MQTKIFKPYVVLLLALTATLSTTACTKKTPNTAAAPAAANTPAPENEASANGQQATPPSSSLAGATLPQPDPNYPTANYINLTSANQLMFLYYALSGMPADYSKIAKEYSRDYRNTSDEFKQHDILKAITPQIDASISAAKNQRYCWVTTNINVAHYNFSKKTFPINTPAGLSIMGASYDSYGINFKNSSDYNALPVPDESLAKDIESRVGNFESFNIKIYFFAQNVNLSNNTINFVITRVDLLSRNGTVLTSYSEK